MRECPWAFAKINGAATVRERSVPPQESGPATASGPLKGIKTPGFSTERSRDCRPMNDRELMQGEFAVGSRGVVSWADRWQPWQATPGVTLSYRVSRRALPGMRPLHRIRLRSCKNCGVVRCPTSAEMEDGYIVVCPT